MSDTHKSDKKTNIKRQKEIHNIINMWHKFIKIKLSLADIAKW